MADAPHLEVAGMRKEYPGAQAPAVDGVDLRVRQGEMLALLGPSGCGKTTTLRMVAGLVEPTAGTITVAGRDVTQVPVHRRGMGMVFQSFALLPHLSVAGNVAFGLDMRKLPAAEKKRRVAEILDRVQLGHLAQRRIGQLSGGQQQRVALARALVVDPSVLLLDEPLSALDAKLRESLRTEIREMQLSSGTTAVFVTHDQDEALSMADRVAVMDAGRVAQIGTPQEIYENPADVFVATFIGRANLLDGVLGTSGVDVPGLGTLPVTTSRPPGPVTALLRPQAVQLLDSPSSQGFAGNVRSASYTGDQITYRIDAAGHTFEVDTVATGAPLDRGAAVRIAWEPAAVKVLPPRNAT
ncbi:ABC transporter ATP-binding protein [Kineosporia mesophila]|uniref:ABC transporter ATP-binding protein n=1 Tax=Kineosporia mesophila TaxID=566012 RepID=UPI001E4F7016|nr:ABC transporter ATP-binding protein [Kineosporia mesophila]